MSTGTPYDGSKKFKSDKTKFKGKETEFWYNNKEKGFGKCRGHYISKNCRC